MNERLRKWMSSESLKPSKLAENIKVNRATISHILSGFININLVYFY